jgi:hypothetical protein
VLKSTIDTVEPIELVDLQKRIVVPREDWEFRLQKWDWTIHQLGRKEYPVPFNSLEEFQLACICADPVLWVQMFLREPEDPDHQDPYSLWAYQIESIRYIGHTIHKTASEVGKTREIVSYSLYKAFTIKSGSGLIGAPLATHLEEIIEAIDEQLTYNPDLAKSRWHRRHKGGWRKHPHHAFYFTNGFKIDFRPSGFDGVAYRGVHAKTFAIKDEAVKDKNKKQWSEFWRAIKPGCTCKIYSVPDGDRSCEFYKLSERALRTPSHNPSPQGRESKNDNPQGENNPRGENKNIPSPLRGEGKAYGSPIGSEPRLKEEPTAHRGEGDATKEVQVDSLKDASSYVRDIRFKLFHWSKKLMPEPFWSPQRKKFYVEQYGGEDTPEYKHNVEGLDGDPESSVFPYEQFRHCIKEIPEYRCLKILVDSGNNEVSVTGYRCEITLGDDGSPIPKFIELIDTTYKKSAFFDGGDIPSPLRGEGKGEGEPGESDFRRLIKNFFIPVPGLKRGGADFGFSGDPTEIIVKHILGERERIVARLCLKHVTYDQQCQALDALDDIYGPKESISWGTDFGNAGSAVAHDLQGLPQYQDKNYDDRLKGFMFESVSDDVDEDGRPIIDAKDGKPYKKTLKELATDHMIKKVQHQRTEYPPDPDYVLYYPNHTVSYAGKHRTFKKKDDHLIDAERCEILAKIFLLETEDMFA